MTTTEERRRAQPPDLEPEREVDFSRYLDALVARWWLPVAGLIIGAAIGYFLALGGKDVFRAQATVYVAANDVPVCQAGGFVVRLSGSRRG